MDRTASAPTQKSTTYTPLADLKYHYQSTSRPSSIQGSASTALPLISSQRSKYRALSSRSHEYTRTIDETLRMKLKLGQIHDRISSIDAQMRHEVEKYRAALERHSNFEKSFDLFLGKRYDRVKQRLLELEAHETEYDRLWAQYGELRQTVTIKSLRIYELERVWRRYKTSELFISHIAGLLKTESSDAATGTAAADGTVVSTPDSPCPNFSVDPQCDTPTLDDLVDNYRLHDSHTQPFADEHYAHVTAARVDDFLDKLKRQNVRLLRHTLESEKVKNILQDVKEECDADAQNRSGALAHDVDEAERRLQLQNDQLSAAERTLNEVVHCGRDPAGADVEALRKFVVKLYDAIFEPACVEQSQYVQMAKCVEDYVQSLLCRLYSYEPEIVKKALRRS